MKKLKYRTMEEPPRVANLPHYKGIPIPYTTMTLEDGTPHFKAVGYSDLGVTVRLFRYRCERGSI